MATKHVSASTDNGYVVGNDSNDGDSITTPYLTVIHALTQVSNDDTLLINDGTYPETTYIEPTNTGLTINSVTRHGAIIQNAASGGARVMHVNVAGTNLTIGEIVLDAGDDEVTCLTTTGTTTVITSSGTKFLNPAQYFINLTAITTVVIDDWTCEGGTLAQHGIRWGSNVANATCQLSNGVMTITDLTGSKAGIVIDPAATGTALTINGNVLNIAPDSSAHLVRGIQSKGGGKFYVYDNTVNITTSAAPTGIDIGNDAGEVATICEVYNNIVTSDQNAGGLGILVGKDADTDLNENSITNAHVYDNTITKFDHGLLIGNVTGSVVYGNKIAESELGVVFKADDDSFAHGNIIINCMGLGALRFKGSTNSTMSNNLVIYETGFSDVNAKGIVADKVTTGPTHTTGAECYNNSIYSDGSISNWVDVDTDSDCTFDANNYYADTNAAFTSNRFQYEAATYATVTLWNAAATVGTDTETAPAIDSATYISEGLKGTGVYWWGAGSRPTGYGGEPFSTFDTDVGSTQSTTGPFHPVNL